MAIAYIVLPTATFYDQVDKINEIIDYLNAPTSPITNYANLTVNPGPLLVGTNIDNAAANTQLRANSRSRALDVYGVSAFDDGTAIIPSISFRNSLNTGFYRQGANSIGVSTNGVNRMTINANGFVGIGTQTPSTPLHIVGSLTYTGISFNNANSTGYNDLIGTNSTERYYLIASLPLSNAGNYAAINFKGTFGQWQNSSGPRYLIDAYFSNRDSFNSSTAVRRSEFLTSNSIRPVVYQQTDGSIDIYVYCPVISFQIFSCEISNSIQVNANPNYRTYTTTTPVGTLVYDAFTARKDINVTSSGVATFTTTNGNNTGGLQFTDIAGNISGRMWAATSGVYYGSEVGNNVPTYIRANGVNIVSFSTGGVQFNANLNSTTASIGTLNATTLTASTSISLNDFSVLPTTPAVSRVATVSQTDARYLRLAGGTMAGPLILNGPPLVSNQAATKDYVDIAVSAAIPTYISPIIVFSKDINPPVVDSGIGSGTSTFQTDDAGTPLVNNSGSWRTYTIPSAIPSTAKAILIKCVLATNDKGVAVLARLDSTSPTITLNSIYAVGGGDSVVDQTVTVIPIKISGTNLIPTYDLISMVRSFTNYWDYKVVIIGYM